VNPFWVVVLTLASVATGSGLCFWLLHKGQEVNSSVWILEHVICPMIRILVLLFVVSLIYPALDAQTSSIEFWRLLAQQGQLNNLLNILFFAGLLLAFLPLVSHPVFALPIQSILTIALVFSWQYAEVVNGLQLLPSLATSAKIIGYMLLAYLVTRESSIHLSRWLDQRFHIEGSIRLVSDAIYLVLQIPVMLIYCSFLRLQLPA
jgi:uncharacterized membrane protein YciS (DUF1049 family)